MWTFDVMDDRDKSGKRTMIATCKKDGKLFTYTERGFNTVMGKREFMEKAKKELVNWRPAPKVVPEPMPVVEVIPEVVPEPIPEKKTRKRRKVKVDG